MTSTARSGIAGLPHALRDADALAEQTRSRRSAVFLDYDGTLTPIVDRPEDAIISERMRDVVQALACRFPVCVVSGRDRPVVQQLMGVDDLIVAGSHGFDIWAPNGGTIEREEGGDFAELLTELTTRLRDEVGSVEGALIEPKRSSVALHYRLVPEPRRPQIKAMVDGVLADHPERLRVTPGKMVYELQPKLEWDKGRAVLYLLEALELDREDVLPIYIGDDITDEDAFRALSGRGIGILVADPADPEVAGRSTAAQYLLSDVQEVEQFLDGLAR
ncbi:MAG: trehalose-phosphatase [Solirubrobacterales bacterium]|nr:trehalose-phosphatase [Solirubrobacterales bacterium]